MTNMFVERIGSQWLCGLATLLALGCSPSGLDAGPARGKTAVAAPSDGGLPTDVAVLVEQLI